MFSLVKCEILRSWIVYCLALWEEQ